MGGGGWNKRTNCPCQQKIHVGGSPGLVAMGGLTFQRLWVRIPTLYTGWTFFHIYKKYMHKRRRIHGSMEHFDEFYVFLEQTL